MWVLWRSKVEDSRVPATFAHLAQKGFAPKYFGRFSNGRVEEWMDSRPLIPEEMQQVEPVDFLRLIPTELAKLHRLVLPEAEGAHPILWSTLHRFGKCVFDIQFEEPEQTKRLEALDLSRVSASITVVATTKIHSPFLVKAGTDLVAHRACIPRKQRWSRIVGKL